MVVTYNCLITVSKSYLYTYYNIINNIKNRELYLLLAMQLLKKRAEKFFKLFIPSFQKTPQKSDKSK